MKHIYAVAVMFTKVMADGTTNYAHRLLQVSANNRDEAEAMTLDQLWKDELSNHSLLMRPMVLKIRKEQNDTD